MSATRCIDTVIQADFKALMMALSCLLGLYLLGINPSESLTTVPATEADQGGISEPQSVSVTLPLAEPVLPTAPKITIAKADGFDTPTASVVNGLGGRIPDASQTHVLEDSGTKASFSTAEQYTLDTMQATDSLQLIHSKEWSDNSQLPQGLGGRVIEPNLTPDPFMVKSDIVVEEPVKDDLPTFDLWLAEQEKQKVVAEDQDHPPVTKTSQKKLRQNFAAGGCGAKVVASNTEAEHTSYLLNGNPDEYMISPCKAKKWFVVELCEPLQIHKVELGTLELFSSQPKSFKLSATQRYPTKEWLPLGTYELKAERTVQSFPTVVLDEFVKFVKVDMMEHYGEEHYCPITTFRVLGLDLASDDDDETEGEHTDTDGQGGVSAETDEIEESVNLFTSAKDTVVKLVKKVLYKGEAEEIAQGTQDGTVDLSENGTVKSDEKAAVEKKEEVPCPDKVSSVEGTKEELTNAELPDQKPILPPVAETPSKEVEEKPIVTKLDATEQLPAETSTLPVVIKLSNDDRDTILALKQSRRSCIHRPLYNYVRQMSPNHSFCALAASDPKCRCQKISGRLTKRFIGTGNVAHTSSSTSDSVMDKNKQRTNDKVFESQAQAHVTEEVLKGSYTNIITAKEELQKTPSSQATNSVESMSKSEGAVEQDAPLPLAPAKIESQQEQEERSQTDLASSQSTTFKSSDVSSTKSELLEPSSLTNQAQVEDEAASVVTPGLGGVKQSRVVEQEASHVVDTLFLKVAPSPTVHSEDSKEDQGLHVPETPTSDKQHKAAANDEGQVTDKQATQASSSQDSNSLDKAPSASVPSDKNSQPQVPTSTEQQVPAEEIKGQGQGQGSSVQFSNGQVKKGVDVVKVGMGTNAKRDMSILKLSNRIVSLEQNVSMTKRYLEELSQSFKKQSEDMMKQLNKTVSKLNTHTAQADEKDLKQLSEIASFEEKVANLTKLVVALQMQVDTMGQELNQKQWLISMFQVFLFLWLLIYTCRSRTKPKMTLVDHQFLLDTMPSQPQVDHQRRNSDVGLASAVAEPVLPLKRQSSETNLACGLSGADITSRDTDKLSFSLTSTGQTSKKKKKKKLKHVLSADGLTQCVDSMFTMTQAEPVQTPSFSSSAGVLFGVPKESGQQELGSDKENQSKEGLGLRRVSIGTEHKERSALSPTQSVLNSGFFSDQVSVPTVINKDDQGTLQNSFNSFNPQNTSPSQKVLSKHIRDSPEFKLPPYHRHRARKMGDNCSNNSQCMDRSSSQSPSIEGTPLYQTKDEVVAPGWSTEFFLSDNYLAENRFKFPATPVKYTTERDLNSPSIPRPPPPPPPPLPPASHPARNLMNGHVVSSQLFDRTLLPSSIRYSVPYQGHEEPQVIYSPPSVMPLHTLPSYLSKQAPLGPSFIYFPSENHSSFTSQQIPLHQTPSVRPQYPLGSLPPGSPPPLPPPTIPKDRRPSTAPQSPSDPLDLSFSKPESISIPHINNLNITKEISGSTKTKKSTASHQQHRRQGSYPLEQTVKTKSAEKEVARAKQGGPKQSGKVSGTKLRKSPSGQSEISGRSSQHKVAEGRKPWATVK